MRKRRTASNARWRRAVSQSIPPNSSSDSDADGGDPASAAGSGSGVGPRALVGRLAEEFGADSQTITRVATLFREVRERAPDLFVPAAGTLVRALDTSDPAAEAIYTAIGEWALDA